MTHCTAFPFQHWGYTFLLALSVLSRNSEALKDAMKSSGRLRYKHAWFLGISLFCSAVALHVVRAQESPNLNRDAILGHLNAVITWYRNATNRVQGTGLPSD